VILAAAVTVVGLLPAMLHQIRRPSNQVSNAPCELRIMTAHTAGMHLAKPCNPAHATLQGLLLCMANCAMVFFMFSYQVC
jgi:hypothetical protein